jgi:hypothetical protein
MLVSCLAYSSTLKMDVTSSSETSAFNGLHGVISQKIELCRKAALHTIKVTNKNSNSMIYNSMRLRSSIKVP